MPQKKTDDIAIIVVEEDDQNRMQISEYLRKYNKRISLHMMVLKLLSLSTL